MATYHGGIAGEIRGKLGGVVFTRSAGRAVIRTYVKPIQPRSEAQLEARARFGEATQSYHSLTNIQKAKWESYAKTIFNAKDQFNEGQWSGANAYVSLRNLVGNADSNGITAKYTDQADIALDGTAVPFIYTNESPTDQLAANISNGILLPPSAMSIVETEIYDDGTYEVELEFLGVGPGGLGQGAMIDAKGNKFGFAVFISEAINQEHNFVKNPCNQVLGYMPGIDAGIASLEGKTGMKILADTPYNIEKFKSFPQVDSEVQVKIYLVSERGMIACIGAARTTILSPVT